MRSEEIDQLSDNNVEIHPMTTAKIYFKEIMAENFPNIEGKEHLNYGIIGSLK